MGTEHQGFPEGKRRSSRFQEEKGLKRKINGNPKIGLGSPFI